jgi:hypothetical protein
MPGLTERIESKITGFQIALECEEAVVERLLPYRVRFNAHEQNDLLTRYVFQLLDSEKTIKNLKQDIEDLEVLLDNYRSQQ